MNINTVAHIYHAEFASNCRARMTLSLSGIDVEWTPDIPRLKGEAGERFLGAYRAWRNESIQDFCNKTGIKVSVIEL